MAFAKERTDGVHLAAVRSLTLAQAKGRYRKPNGLFACARNAKRGSAFDLQCAD